MVPYRPDLPEEIDGVIEYYLQGIKDNWKNIDKNSKNIDSLIKELERKLEELREFINERTK